MSTPPPACMNIVAPVISKACDFLESRERLQGVAFVGNLTTRHVMPIALHPGSEEGKEPSSLTIQSAATMLEAGFIFVIKGSGSLRPDRMPQMDAILDKYGAIHSSRS